METSLFVAQLLAVVYIVVGLGLVLNTGHYQKVFGEFFKSSASTYLGGILALVAGFLLISYHNIWEQSWVVLITIIGWAALLKGFMLLVFPNAFISFSKAMFKTKHAYVVIGIFAIIFGLVLGYFGFMQKPL